MIIFPAIDLRHGRCVRLQQGRRDQETVYGDDPAAVARRWEAAGATWLHVVNLDGAFADEEGAADQAPANLQALAAIVAAISIPVQFGGGLRSWAAISRAFDLGVSRVVLGTAAVQNPALLEEALGRLGSERVALGIDAKDGWVTTHGWEQTSQVRAIDLGKQMRGVGIQHVIYTDISRDGMLAGVNVEATANLARETGLSVIASGGVKGLADMERLLREPVIEGVIIGRALYTGDLSLEQALALVQGAH